jgi:thymidylate synthase (FAD)
VITSPTVEIIAATQFRGHSVFKIPADGDDATKTSSFAAKGCYDSYGESGRSNEANQKQIIQTRHGSVLEHVSCSLFITGITRALSLELNRHRHLAISQRSTRYTAEEDCSIVLEPYYAMLYEKKQKEPALLSTKEYGLLTSHLACAKQAVRQYHAEVETLMELNPRGLEGVELRKWARGKARNILPHGLETRGTWTGNLRTWRHVIEMRTERVAEEEIRRLGAEIVRAVREYAPLYFDDYTVENINGIFEYRTEFRKV